MPGWDWGRRREALPWVSLPFRDINAALGPLGGFHKSADQLLPCGGRVVDDGHLVEDPLHVGGVRRGGLGKGFIYFIWYIFTFKLCYICSPL